MAELETWGNRQSTTQQELASQGEAKAASTLAGEVETRTTERQIAEAEVVAQMAEEQSGNEQMTAKTGPTSDADSCLAAAWFERLERQYLEPHTAMSVWDENPERSFEVSVQDTSRRRVGMDFIRRTEMDFEHFVAHVELYRQAAEGRGYRMDVTAHAKGHRRLSVSWTTEVGRGAEEEEDDEEETTDRQLQSRGQSDGGGCTATGGAGDGDDEVSSRIVGENSRTCGAASGPSAGPAEVPSRPAGEGGGGAHAAASDTRREASETLRPAQASAEVAAVAVEAVALAPPHRRSLAFLLELSGC